MHLERLVRAENPHPDPSPGLRCSTVGSPARRARWVDVRWPTWTTAWCTTTVEQHLLDVVEALEIFRRRNLFAKSSKGEFGRRELDFLGHCQSEAGVSVDHRKVQSILEWANPKSCTEIRRFTCLANYYRRFVEGFA